MGRRRTIDREQVLDVAERLVAERGAGSLTIGTVAEAAGISKGGVQSAFGTKEGLIAAILKRWMADEQRRFADRAGKHPTPLDRARAHLQTTQEDDEAAQARAAGLLAALVQSPEHLAGARDWYRDRVGDLAAEGDQARFARVVFLAAEGAFFLRHLRLLHVDQKTWDDIFSDLHGLLSRQLLTDAR
jgi:AcrR family transcriptional regulator